MDVHDLLIFKQHMTLYGKRKYELGFPQKLVNLCRILNAEIDAKVNIGRNFIELNRLYTTQLTVVNLQLVTSATCFGPVWPSSGLQRLLSIKVHNVAVPMGSHGLHGLYVLY